MEENREYISYDVVDNGSDFIEHCLESNYVAHSINAGNEFLMHYGVKGMKWHQHKKQNEVSEAALRGIGYRAPKDALNRYGRTAVYKGLSKNPKVRESYQKAERKAIDRRLAKQAARTARGRQLIAKKQMIKRLKNKKLKKAAIKRWRSQREHLYETL